MISVLQDVKYYIEANNKKIKHHLAGSHDVVSPVFIKIPKQEQKDEKNKINILALS